MQEMEKLQEIGEKVNKIDDKVNRIYDLLGGNESLGTKGLVKEFKEHEKIDIDFQENIKTTTNRIRGGIYVLGALFALLTTILTIWVKFKQ